MSTIQNHFEDTDNMNQALRQGPRVGRRTARHVLDAVTDRAAEWRDELVPVSDRLSARASDAARNSAHWLRDHGDRVRTQAARASGRTAGYVRQEPVKAALMVAAAGMLAYAISRLFTGRSQR